MDEGKSEVRALCVCGCVCVCVTVNVYQCVISNEYNVYI